MLFTADFRISLYETDIYKFSPDLDKLFKNIYKTIQRILFGYMNLFHEVQDIIHKILKTTVLTASIEFRKWIFFLL